ncbi:MAG TPA: DoxX family protein [Anaerolineae bacterium]|nr:DoxX family protein [Anaerolineae bacterium]
MKEKFRWFILILFSLLFIGSGILHFIQPDIYMPMMPPILPWPLALIYISGFFELIGGIGLWLPAWRRWAGWGLIALLIAVFPANLYMALYDIPLNGQPVSPLFLWLRLPLQGVMIVAVWWAAVRTEGNPQNN